LQPHLDSLLLLHQASTKLERKIKEQEGRQRRERLIIWSIIAKE
jgi:hypothetical protein